MTALSAKLAEVLRLIAEMDATVDEDGLCDFRVTAVRDAAKFSIAFCRTHAAELDGLVRDKDRLDYLDSLTKRTYKLTKDNSWPITSDMHFAGDYVSLYVRTGIGSDVENQGHAKTVREAIDAALKQGERQVSEPKCKVDPSRSCWRCPNFKEVEGDLDMEYERYECKVCGVRDKLDYEEMR